VRLISTIHDATVVNTGKKDRRTDLEIQKPYTVFKYHKFMKGIIRTDKYVGCPERVRTLKIARQCTDLAERGKCYSLIMSLTNCVAKTALLYLA
jgi:hypothetical protein